MKKIVAMASAGVVVLALASCGSKKEAAKEDFGNPEASSSAPKETPEDLIAQGESLVKASDCKTCHHPTNKIIGPPHMEVAKKYEFTAANVKMLADKIIKGGQGVWGEIPMAAHPDITQENAEKMARYVLSMDGEKEH